MLRELAYAKLNLVLHVGQPREDGLHPICSLMASIDLADEVTAEPRASPARTPFGARACRATTSRRGPSSRVPRTRAGRGCPPLAIAIDKRIPVAAGLGGGSADAAATLRMANELAGGALGAEELLRLAADLGSDVPSQLDPATRSSTGTGERSRADRGCRRSPPS